MSATPGAQPVSLLEQLRSELAEYFSGARRAFAVPLVYPGTPFQVKVWDALRQIPYGETRSYETLAWSVGAPGGAAGGGTRHRTEPGGDA